jgi:FHA domain protein
VFYVGKHEEKSPHFYAVVDCAKAVSFPSRLAQAGEMANLYNPW